MKCGTTTIYEHLITHPEIAKGIIKEPEYFSKNFGNPEYKKGRYEDLFEINRDKHLFTLDASTGYTKYPVEKGVPKRIKDYGLNPYFIYVVRNPFERIASHYNYMKKNLLWKGKIDSAHLINTSKYYMQLEQYRTFFDRSKFLVIDFEELKSNPKEMYKKIFSFLGAADFTIINKNHVVKNQTKLTNRKQLYVSKKLSFFAKYSPSIFNKVIKKTINIIFPPKQNYLTKKQICRIKGILNDDMQKLKDEYDIDIEKWIQR